MTDSPPPLLRPLPRRPFELSSASSTPRPDAFDSSGTHTRDSSEDDGARDSLRGGALDTKSSDESESISRNKSLLNLTSSTLFGIYAPTAFDSSSQYRESEPPTPWGTGAETPARGGSLDGGRPVYNELHRTTPTKARARTMSEPRRPSKIERRRGIMPTIGRVMALFVLGVGYGALVSQLHDKSSISPIRVDGINRRSYTYAAFWGLAGVALGSLLPYLDNAWRSRMLSSSYAEEHHAADWTTIVRSIGAFVGIAFAIRKLPWQSTLQVSLTLALVNPALWYLLDRTVPGIALSSIVSTLGTTTLLLVNPGLVPHPPTTSRNTTMEHEMLRSTAAPGQGSSQLWPDEPELLGGLVTYESIGVATWIGSVLFCSCICFGNIGRKMGVV